MDVTKMLGKHKMLGMDKCSWSYFTLTGVRYLVAGENLHCQKLIKTQGKLETFKKLPGKNYLQTRRLLQ